VRPKVGSLDESKEIDTDGITVSSCVGVCDGESVTGDIVGVCDGEFVTVDMVTASHQIRSGIPRNSATDISSTVPPTPKNPLIFFRMQPLYGYSPTEKLPPVFIARNFC
jgi:hypothetical protein